MRMFLNQSSIRVRPFLMAVAIMAIAMTSQAQMRHDKVLIEDGSGLWTTLKSETLTSGSNTVWIPKADGMTLTLVNPVSASQSFAKGDVLYADNNAHNYLSRLSAGTTGYVLTMNASGLPDWEPASGGFATPMTTLGDIIYEDATPAAARLAGNTTTTQKFLAQTGTGSASAAPSWTTLAASDIPSLDASKITSGTLNAARLPDLSGTYVSAARTISAGTGLTGGGDLSANRTISLDLSANDTWTGAESFAPTTDIVSATVQQTSAASPTADIFDVTNSNASTKFLWIDNAGQAHFNSTIAGSINGNAATVTNGVYTTGSYANPSWITSLAASKITGSFSTSSITAGSANTFLTTASDGSTVGFSGFNASSNFTGNAVGTALELATTLSLTNGQTDALKIHQAASNTDGDRFNIAAGAGNGSGKNGGGLYLDGGAAGSGGTNGAVYIGSSNAGENVNIGNATGTTTFTGTVSFPSNAISESMVSGLTSDLAGKVATSRTISAGTGLSGGGDLSADRTISLNLAANDVWTGAASFAPTTDITGLTIKGTSAASPTADIFDVKNSAGNTTYFSVDKNGNVGLGQLSASLPVKTNASSQLTTGAINIASGSTEITGTLAAGSGGTGQSSYTIGDLLYASGSSALSKLAIGTANQVLTVNSSANGYTWTNASGSGTVTSVAVSGGTTGLTTSGGPITTSGTITLDGTLAVANGGTGGGSASAARTNLGVAASGANSDITSLSGITTPLSIAQGGTGSATTSANIVFAGPTSGGSAAPSFRSLVAADIPSLDASKITSGQLTIAQGGTGAATASANVVFAGPTTGAAGAPSFRSLVAADLPPGSGNYINNGTSQQSSASFNVDGSGAVGTTFSAGTSTTTPIVYGGSAAGSTLSLTSTSNGSPSGDYVRISTGGSERARVTNAGLVGVGTNSPNLVMDINGDWGTRMHKLTLPSANTTFDTLNIGSYSNIKLTGPTAAFSLKGIAGGYDGKRIRIFNATGQDMTLKNKGSGIAANNIITLCGSDATLTKSGAAELVYDADSSAWISIANLANAVTGVPGSSTELTHQGTDKSYSGTTLTNDTALSFSVTANQQWDIDGILFIIGTASTTDLKFAVSIPSGSEIAIAVNGMATGTSASNGIGASVITASATAATNNMKCGQTQSMVWIHGTFKTGAVGTVYLQNALGTGSGTVTIQGTSFLKATRIN